MDNLELITALSRSNILEYDENALGNKGTIYINYERKVGYVWNDTLNQYELLFDGAVAKGLNYRGVYNPITNNPDIISADKQIGDFWMANSPSETLHAGDWLIYNGSGFDILAKYNSEVLINQNSSENISMFNMTYLVDTSNGKVELPLVSPVKGDKIKVIKTTDDTNIVIVAYVHYLRVKNDSIELMFDGDEWIIYNQNIYNNKFKDVGLLRTEDGLETWKIHSTDDGVIVGRYFNDELTETASIGETIKSDRMLLSNVGGKIGYRNVGGGCRTLIAPSKDANGVCIGNGNGSATILHNGSLYSTTFQNSISTDTVNGLATEYQDGYNLSYKFKSNKIQSVKTVKINLSNVQANTKLRYCVTDSAGNVLEENVSNSGLYYAGLSVQNGVNTITLAQDVVLPNEYEFYIKLYFTATVRVNGATTNLNDGYGVRFVPYIETTYLYGTVTNVLTESSIKTYLESLIGDARINTNAIKNKMFSFNTSTTLTRTHANSTIYFYHTSGVCICSVTESDFMVGDKIRIYGNADVMFGEVKITKDNSAEFQKYDDGVWLNISSSGTGGSVSKMYYSTDGAEIQNPENCEYITNYKYGDNSIKFKVPITGSYLLYVVLPYYIRPSEFTESLGGSHIIDGIPYETFYSNSTTAFTQLEQNVDVYLI